MHLFVGEWMILSIERVIRMSGEEVSIVFVLQKDLPKFVWKLLSRFINWLENDYSKPLVSGNALEIILLRHF